MKEAAEAYGGVLAMLGPNEDHREMIKDVSLQRGGALLASGALV